MNDGLFWTGLVIVALINIALGALLFLYGIGPMLDWENGTESQTLTISNTSTLDNCDHARQVGDNACNATIMELPLAHQGSMLLGAFMVVLGIGNLVIVGVASR